MKRRGEDNSSLMQSASTTPASCVTHSPHPLRAEKHTHTHSFSLTFTLHSLSHSFTLPQPYGHIIRFCVLSVSLPHPLLLQHLRVLCLARRLSTVPFWSCHASKKNSSDPNALSCPRAHQCPRRRGRLRASMPGC
jgi:hypothetical protein